MFSVFDPIFPPKEKLKCCFDGWPCGNSHRSCDIFSKPHWLIFAVWCFFSWSGRGILHPFLEARPMTICTGLQMLSGVSNINSWYYESWRQSRCSWTIREHCFINARLATVCVGTVWYIWAQKTEFPQGTLVWEGLWGVKKGNLLSKLVYCLYP